MDSSIEKEVLQDFKTALSKIDFNGYNPNSAEFLSALFTGEMWRLIRKLNQMDSSHEDYEIETSEEKASDEISEELSGAKKYLQKYLDSNDELFQQMASDELKHAGILIKKAYSKLPNAEEKSKLKSYENELNSISKQLESI